MKAEELMIGDWVRNTEFGKNGIDRIEDVEPRRVWLEHGTTYVPLCYIEPIPLNPEILKKNGLVKIDDLEGVSRYYIKLLDEETRCVISFSFYDLIVGGVKTLLKCWYEFRGGTNSIHKCNVLYVHELQHALRLCGIEKEIEP